MYILDIYIYIYQTAPTSYVAKENALIQKQTPAYLFARHYGNSHRTGFYGQMKLKK